MHVYRLEHVACSAKPDHGPCVYPEDCDTEDLPAFGWVGVPPNCDMPPINVSVHDLIGCADEQVDSWFGFDWMMPGDDDYESMLLKAHRIPAGWAFVSYEVPEFSVKRAMTQVAFMPSLAKSRELATPDFYSKHQITEEGEAA